MENKLDKAQEYLLDQMMKTSIPELVTTFASAYKSLVEAEHFHALTAKTVMETDEAYDKMNKVTN